MSSPVAILAIADVALRDRLSKTLQGLRWQVLSAAGGAEALAQLESGTSSAVIADAWLPDLEIEEFLKEVEANYPDVDLISSDGSFERAAKSHNNRRGELLYALRTSQEFNDKTFLPTTDLASNETCGPRSLSETSNGTLKNTSQLDRMGSVLSTNDGRLLCSGINSVKAGSAKRVDDQANTILPEFRGMHQSLLEVCRRIRLVSPRKTPVLIQGPSGTGKELVARALHRLSPRSTRPFVALNCAAIPESLLEAELFGHTKGAFTGAVQGRVGRIEAANGGTLFLDEIGEMPLPLQAKLLRFLEAGELQRVGDNDTIHVDVRVIAASHQNLSEQAGKALFRMDLFYRLAVFLIQTPALSQHLEDIPVLVEFFLEKLIDKMPAKVVTPGAMEKLRQHEWPGNVRELAHVVERAYILAEDRFQISQDDIEFT